MVASAAGLEWIAKRCLTMSLLILAIIAVLVNLAFYGAMMDFWAFAHMFGPLVVFGAALMLGVFLLGFLLQGAAVLVGARGAAARAKTIREVPARRRAA